VLALRDVLDAQTTVGCRPVDLSEHEITGQGCGVRGSPEFLLKTVPERYFGMQQGLEESMLLVGWRWFLHAQNITCKSITWK